MHSVEKLWIFIFPQASDLGSCSEPQVPVNRAVKNLNSQYTYKHSI